MTSYNVTSYGTVPPTNVTADIKDATSLITRDHLYLLPIIIVIGIIGNFLSAAVLLRRRFRSMTSSIYLLALAVTDTMCLLLDLKVQQYLEMHGLPYFIHHPSTCLLYWWLIQSIPFVSSWLVAAVTIERVIIVLRPLKAKIICTRLKTLIIVVSIFVVMLAGATYLFAVVDPETCNVPPQIKHFVVIVAIVTFSLLPFCVIFVCNMTIVVKLIQQRKFISQNMAATSAHTQSDTNRITGMLIANSCVFIILTLPYNVLVSYRVAIGKTGRFDVASQITTYMVTINHSINFLLYVICGSLYRKELLLMFCPRRCHSKGRGRFTELESNTIQSHV